jgi:antitoxin ParD1/3/4
MKDFVEHQAAQRGYRTTSEYFCKLIREDQKRRAREKVEALLLQGLQSEASEMTREDWEQIRREGWASLAVEQAP